MMRGKLKRLAKTVCPPVVWEAARRLYRPAPPFHPAVATTFTRVSTLEEIDAMIARAHQAGQRSFDAYWAVLSRHYFPTPRNLPADPTTPEYHRAQMCLYHEIAGRASYSAASCEVADFDLEMAVDLPFPYNSGSSQMVGDQLLAIGSTIRALDLSPPGSILEFGPGYGKLTVELAQARFRVTAVDISPALLEVIARRARMVGRFVETVCSDMLDYQPTERFDRVLFYECFHHCSDHVAMIRRLDGMVAEGGAAVFAGEPIEDDFPMPWGVRLDGHALRAIRVHGWLELGFRTDYFLGLLDRHGWRAERRVSADAPTHSVIVARRK